MRKLRVTPLSRVIIYVGDVQKCASFYADVFGFAAVASDLNSSDWTELDTGGCRLAFIKAHGPDGPINSPTGSAMNPHKIVFYAEDVEAARATLAARGALMGDVRRFGSQVLCDGKDPEGHVFQISNIA
jgi:catechol 2,3-dioxygenase-like lactoylglutathione lyase family enzyme